MNEIMRIGCIADDFTGASDVCSFLLNDAHCVLINGVPEESVEVDADVVVIALKIRSAAVEEALASVSAALDWFDRMGIDHIYDKYCSTFDSSDKGNIGPILDYLLERYDERFTLVSPALPDNKREVFNGYLFADGKLLSEGSMRNHPITPMKDSNLKRLLDVQSKYESYSLDHRVLYKQNFVWSEYKDAKIDQERFYIIPDYYQDKHGEILMEHFGNLRILSGSSILIAQWYRYLNQVNETKGDAQYPVNEGKTVLLSGSLSNQTKKQISFFINDGGQAIEVPVEELDNTSLDWALSLINESENDILFYSKRRDSKESDKTLGNKLESFYAELASELIKAGIDKIVVAGGETSGSVIKALPYKAYKATKNVAKGVPILRPIEDTTKQIILKSGNFGQEDFFSRSIKLLKE